MPNISAELSALQRSSPVILTHVFLVTVSLDFERISKTFISLCASVYDPYTPRAFPATVIPRSWLQHSLLVIPKHLEHPPRQTACQLFRDHWPN